MRDDVNQDGVTGDSRIFMINGSEFNVRDREINIELVEVVTEE